MLQRINISLKIIDSEFIRPKTFLWTFIYSSKFFWFFSINSYQNMIWVWFYWELFIDKSMAWPLKEARLSNSHSFSNKIKFNYDLALFIWLWWIFRWCKPLLTNYQKLFLAYISSSFVWFRFWVMPRWETKEFLSTFETIKSK